MTYNRAAQIFMIVAAILVASVGLKELLADNLTAATACFWSVAWMFIHHLNQDQIKRLRAVIKTHTEVTNLMATHLSDEQFEKFRAQLKAAESDA
ncbi:hypothetical protein [Streptosporangium lutulentum]|uniref:Low affinity iron permease n=1 Tax=Streptosporangium lutulentum TaxID=1461250 RepID=A0ABT9QUD8_9ACTN|nr:hypothetical protein [Streptosporangium lutulentum]MDP9850365.1 hypothetical protein [Streptosporangium lutulentum]